MQYCEIIACQGLFDNFYQTRVYGSDGVLGFCLDGEHEDGVVLVCKAASCVFKVTLFADFLVCMHAVEKSKSYLCVCYAHVANNMMIRFPLSSYVPVLEHVFDINTNGIRWIADDVFSLGLKILDLPMASDNKCAYFAAAMFLGLFGPSFIVSPYEFENNIGAYNAQILISNLAIVLRDRCRTSLRSESASEVSKNRLRYLLSAGYALMVNMPDGTSIFDENDNEIILDDWHFVVLVPCIDKRVIIIDTVGGFRFASRKQIDILSDVWKNSGRNFIVIGAKRGDCMVSDAQLVQFVVDTKATRVIDIRTGQITFGGEMFSRVGEDCCVTNINTISFVDDICSFRWRNNALLSDDGVVLRAEADDTNRVVDVAYAGKQLEHVFPTVDTLKARAKAYQMRHSKRESISIENEANVSTNSCDDLEFI